VAEVEERPVTFVIGEAATVDQQIRRISLLLDEINALAGMAHILPRRTILRARIVLNRAQLVLDNWVGSTEALDDGGDPQPELDNERLERMYRSLDLGA
jgi:hypothetical protein